MSREHGTNACYVFGPEPGSDPRRGCRCPACTEANRVAASHRNREIIYGRWQPYVDAGPAREHLRMLSAAGVGWKQAAKLAGLSNGGVSKILYGGPGSRPPSRRIRPETETAILAVRPLLEVVADRTPVDATGTRRRLQALVARGWSQAKIADRLGVTRENLGQLISRRPVVTAATARAVAALYGVLEHQAPPEAGHRDKIAASRARRYAAARGWPPPAAWDSIDDPGAAPADGWQRRDGLSPAELAAEARDLEAIGLDRRQMAERLGVTQHRITRAIRTAEEAGDAA